MRATLTIIVACVFTLATITIARETTDPAKVVQVKSKSKPANAWKEYATRPLEAVAGFESGKPGPAVDKFGGRTDRSWAARGFFYAKQDAGRWWLVDPDGHAFIHVGVATVTAGRSPAVQTALKQKFGSKEKWAEATSKLLADDGFNGTGAWTDNASLRATARPPVYTSIWNFMSGFGKSKKITTQKPGHAGYPNDCLPVFHPEFEAYCIEQAKQLAATKDDPYLLGHFSDNELPFPQLAKYLELDVNDAVMGSTAKAARQWLADRKKKADVSIKDAGDDDRDAFAGFIFERYFAITTKAIRQGDPNHLCLGSRYHSNEKKSPACFAAAGKHLDVIAVNLYGQWTPDMAMLKNWEKWSGRPCIITEWYTKGEDSGFANTTGAGWIVPTQQDRGLFYQNFTLQLLESGVCVGWHWFKYQDNDPADLTTDPSNRDSNKGIVTIGFDGYAPLLERMKRLNAEVYRLTDYFDGQGK